MTNLVKTGPLLVKGKPLRDLLQERQREFFAERGPVNVAFLVPLGKCGLQAYDEATVRFASGQRAYGEKVGVRVNAFQLQQPNMQQALHALGRTPAVQGVVMGEPLPDPGRLAELRAVIPTDKDIDGANPASRFSLLRPTPSAMVHIARAKGFDLSTANLAVLGSGGRIGSSLMRMLQVVYGVNPYGVDRHNEAELPDVVRKADVVFSAVNRARLITADMLTDSSKLIVDAAIIPQRRADGSEYIIGSVDPGAYEDSSVRSAITPVPGGVGTLNPAMMFVNLQTVIEGASAVA